MPYREQQSPCAFCDDAAESSCRRCKAAVCELDRNPGAWCLVCQQELDEMQLETAFRSDAEARAPLNRAHHQMRPGGWLGTSNPRPGSSAIAAFASSFVVRIDTVFRRREVRKRFLTRTAAEIAAWRASAGIRAR